MSLSQRLSELWAEIGDLAEQSGRARDSVRLIAVSKTHPSALIEEAMQAGQLSFGENRVQEALEKMESLYNPNLDWHLIGHLQKNKARFCPGNFGWVHSVDSVELLQMLEKQCALQQQPIQILLQANLSKEESKSGVNDFDSMCRLAEAAADCHWLRWRGLMTMAAVNSSEVDVRKTFAQLRSWLEKLQGRFALPDLTELSMGMSSDYHAAIEEGATMVRLGTTIFGYRDVEPAA